MRVPNLPENIALSTALDAADQIAKSNGNLVATLGRFTQAQRMGTIPAWLSSVVLWELSDGKQGFHPLHMRPGETIAAILDKSNKEREKVAQIALRHPDRGQRAAVIAVIDTAFGKDKRLAWQNAQS